MKRAEELIEKYNSGIATPEEKAIVESWYLKYKTPPSDLKPTDLLEEHRLGLEKLQYSLQEHKTRRFWWPVSIAAGLLLVMGLGWFAMNSEKKVNKEQFASNLLPETNSAILTLANGKKIVLSEDNIGEIAAEARVNISQTADGQLVYTVVDHDKEKPADGAYNTIETPRGNQYRIVLPDGSQVFLSSASKLRYPVRFSEKERGIELTGQAHFEIVPAYSSSTKGAHPSKRNKVPFIVKAGNQEVEVLGTQFSVNAYEDDEFIETALLEGSVKVRIAETDKEVLLKPGQKAINGGQGVPLAVEEFDVTDLKAWKEGYFIFNNENIKDIMKKLARWYGFEVEYVGDMRDVAFQGNYLRTRDVKHLLKTMEMANSLQFEIIDKNDERRIIVRRKKT